MSAGTSRNEPTQVRDKNGFRPRDYALIVVRVFAYCILVVVAMAVIVFFAFMLGSR